MSSSAWPRLALQVLLVGMLPSLLQATFFNLYDKKGGKGGGYSFPVVYMLPPLYGGGYGAPATSYGTGLSGLGGYGLGGLGGYGLGGLGGHGLSGLSGHGLGGLGSYGLGGLNHHGLSGYSSGGLGGYGNSLGYNSPGSSIHGNLNSNPHGPLGSYNNGYGGSSFSSGPYSGHSTYSSPSGYGGLLYTHVPAYTAAAKSDAKYSDHKLVIVKELNTGGSEHDKGMNHNFKLQDEGYSHPYAHSDQTSFLQYPKMFSDQPHHLYKIKEFEFDKGYNGHGIGFHKMIEYDLRSAKPQTGLHHTPNIQHPDVGGDHRTVMKRSVNPNEYPKLPLVNNVTNDSLISLVFSNKTINQRKSRGLYIPPYLPMLPPPRPILLPPKPVFIPYYKPIVPHHVYRPYPMPIYRTPIPRPIYQVPMRPIYHPIARPRYGVQTRYPSNLPFRPPTTVGYYRYRRDLESQRNPAETAKPPNQPPNPTQPQISHPPPHSAHLYASSPNQNQHYAKSAEAGSMSLRQYHQYGYKPAPHPVQVHISNPPPLPHKYYPHLPSNPVQVHVSAPRPLPEKYYHLAKSAETAGMPRPHYHQYGYQPSPPFSPVHLPEIPPPHYPSPPLSSYHHYAKSAESQYQQHGDVHHGGQGHHGYHPSSPTSHHPSPYRPPPLAHGYTKTHYHQ